VLDLPLSHDKHENIMSAAPKNDPNNEIFVRREEILELFSDKHGAPPSKASFFRYVDTGKVKKARGLQGWYNTSSL